MHGAGALRAPLCVQLRGRRAVAGCADGRIFVYDALAGGLSRQPPTSRRPERAKPLPPRAAPDTNGEFGVRRRPAAAKEEEEDDEEEDDDDDEAVGWRRPFFVALLVAVALACGGVAVLNVLGRQSLGAATPEEAVEILE